MTRILLLAAAVFAVVLLITRTPGMRRAFYAFLALLVVYALLKATGVIDAWAPDRMSQNWGNMLPFLQAAVFASIILRISD